MKKANKWLWAGFFICAAVLLVINQLGIFPGISLFSMLCTIVLVPVFIVSLAHLNSFGIFFSAAFLLILYDQPLHIEQLTPWTVLIAALLLSIGFTFLIRPRHWPHWHSKDGPFWGYRGDRFQDCAESVNGEDVSCSVNLGSSSKYLYSPSLKSASLNCSLGSLKVFFDQSLPHPQGCEIFLDCSMGSIELYIPKTWKVIFDVETSLAGIEERNRPSYIEAPGAPTLTLKGRISIGSVEITYI